MIDDASEVEACQILTTNAEILSSVILGPSQSVGTRVTEETGKELDLHVAHMAGTDPITDKPSQHHKVHECTIASSPGLPMFFNVTREKSGRPGDEAKCTIPTL